MARRRAIRPLLSPSDPADAVASYYALWHDARRTTLFVHHGSGGRVDGFAAVSQTGADLFKPLVTLRVLDPQAVSTLVQEALIPQRPYQIVAPLELAHVLREHLEVTDASTDNVFELRPYEFKPVINVLVRRVEGPHGTPRYQIESQGHLAALAGTNWRSPSFAEVFVFVHPTGRQRGWGKSVVSACVSDLLEERLRPLYIAPEGHLASVGLAQSLGFSDTGARLFSATVQRP